MAKYMTRQRFLWRKDVNQKVPYALLQVNVVRVVEQFAAVLQALRRAFCMPKNDGQRTTFLFFILSKNRLDV